MLEAGQFLGRVSGSTYAGAVLLDTSLVLPDSRLNAPVPYMDRRMCTEKNSVLVKMA